jgi:hypothetical protein
MRPTARGERGSVDGVGRRTLGRHACDPRGGEEAEILDHHGRKIAAFPA